MSVAGILPTDPPKMINLKMRLGSRIQTQVQDYGDGHVLVQTETYPHVLIGSAGYGYQIRSKASYDALKARQAQGWPIQFIREPYLVWWLDNKDQLEALRQQREASLRKIKEKEEQAWERQQWDKFKGYRR